MIVVHVTHEAVEKIGGIGSVIEGLMTAEEYAKNVSRTILLGPLFSTDRPINMRLGVGGHVLYSSLDALHAPPWCDKFRPIENTYDVGIVYGTRKITEPCTGKSVTAEVLLLDIFHANKARLNLFKTELWQKFNVPSAQFEHVWEYEEYVRLAEPGYEALKAVGINGNDARMVVLSHEYMGMPLALKCILSGSRNTRTVFYAHEVASVRPIVEKSPGHDTMFYNVMSKASAQDQTLENVFPQVFDNYKHALVKAARYCDHVFAVGDYIETELRFLDPHFRTMDIDLVYNGVPAEPLTLHEKQASRQRMRQYAANLTGKMPTWVFTHVARPVLSKAIWRDLRVMHELEPLLAQRGETAVYFMLGTLAGQRRPQDIRHMERVYGWPVHHEKGYPDLSCGEEPIGESFEYFSRTHEHVQAIFVNQWDWNHSLIGERMPADTTFPDIRRGTDLEFGLSIYEPFGISQFEPLSFGAICVTSNVCGCMGFARKAASQVGGMGDNIIEADFTKLAGDWSIDGLMGMQIPQRDTLESAEGERLAEEIVERLPRTDVAMRKMIAHGYELARRMSWEHVVKEYFLPSLNKVSKD